MHDMACKVNNHHLKGVTHDAAACFRNLYNLKVSTKLKTFYTCVEVVIQTSSGLWQQDLT